MKKLLWIITVSLLFSTVVHSETQISAQTISVNTTWTLANSPYYINGDVIVADGANPGSWINPTLTIEPGVQVVFKGYYKLIIRGVLKAKGNAANKIVFRRGSLASENLPNDTIGLSSMANTNGGWHGLVFDAEGAGWNMWDNDSSIMEYCVFKYGKTIIDDANLEGCGGVVRFNWGDGFIRFSNCEFLHNYARKHGGAMFCQGNIIAEKCTFKNNKAYGWGGALRVSTSDPSFSNCIFQYNTATLIGGAISSMSANLKLTHSFIANNTAFDVAGAIALNSSVDFLANNIIVNNKSYQGGTIVINTANPLLVNNTIANNQFEWGGGITVFGFTALRAYNNIFWGNKRIDNNTVDINFDANPTSVPLFTNCIYGVISPNSSFNGLTWENNLNADPQFVAPTANNLVTTDASTANWRLQTISPAINRGIENIDTKKQSGVDFYKQNRRKNGIIDIGAAEGYISKISPPKTINNTVYWNADTVLVTTDTIFITDNGKVIIPPGTKVIFATRAPIVNFGAIIAKGTKEQPITFMRRVSDTAGLSNLNNQIGGWDGILIDNEYNGAKGAMTDNDSSIFEYCNFMYAKKIVTPAVWTHRGGAVSISFYSKVRFSNCTFSDNIGVNGGGICLLNFSNILVENSTFVRNKAKYSGGGLYTNDSSNPFVSGCLFTNNFAVETGGAMDVRLGKPIIYNSVICNNKANGSGAGVVGFNTQAVFVNNTIVHNEASQGGGVAFLNSSSPVFYNTLLWDNNAISDNNGDQVLMSLSPANFYNCNISRKNVTSNNPSDFWPDVAWSWYGDSANIISAEPHFIKPVAIGGNGLLADYSINNFSGNINKGAISIPGLVIPGKDFAGNPRINDGSIDIGAFQNKGKKLEFIIHPQSKPVCLNDTIEFSATLSDTALLQWQKDGVDIPGATSKKYIIAKALKTNSGAYVCKASNSYGTIYSNPVLIHTIKIAPFVEALPKISYVDESLAITLTSNASGDEPLNYNWYKNGTLIANCTDSKLELENTIKESEALYKCRVSNTCGEIETNETKLVIAPQLCMVTNALELDTNKNLLVWDRISSYSYSHFNVYREGYIKDKYVKIGQVPYNAVTIFTDTSVNPKSQAYVYKITAIDSKGLETDIKATAPHKTIHLLVTQGIPSGIQLDWDEYVGFDYASYSIYRSIDNSAFDSIYSMSSTTRTWTDFNAPTSKNLKYFVAVRKDVACYAKDQKKAGAGPFTSAVSNMEDNSRLKFSFDNIENSSIIGFEIFPNPFNNTAEIKYQLEKSSDVSISLHDFSGRMVKTITKNAQIAGNYSYNFGDGLQSGIYFLNVRVGEKTDIVKVVKIK